MRLFFIGAGGFLGAITRYLLSGAAQRLSDSVVLPFGTMAVNILGCFCIGMLAYLTEAHSAFSDNQRAFLIVGVLGGFTTFSAFANESVNLLRDGETMWAAVNVMGQVMLCLLAVWGGRMFAHALWR
jgi:CrcB protein